MPFSSLLWRGLPNTHHRPPSRLRNNSVDPQLRQVSNLHENGGKRQDLRHPDEDEQRGEIGAIGDGGEHDDEGHAEEAESDCEDTGHYGLRAHEVVSAEVAILAVPDEARSCRELNYVEMKLKAS